MLKTKKKRKTVHRVPSSLVSISHVPSLVETIFFFIVLIVVEMILFGTRISKGLEYSSFIFPLLVWAALRFSKKVVLLSILITGIISFYSIYRGGEAFEVVQLVLFLGISLALSLVINFNVSKSRTNEERLALLTDVMPQLAWSCSRNGRMDHCNQRWFEYTGLSWEELQGQGGWTQVVHPDDQKQTIEVWGKSMHEGISFRIEHRLKQADGQYLWHLSLAEPILDYRGNVIQWSGTSTNIDHEKRSEQVSKFLSEASRQLSTSLDYQKTIDSLALLSVGAFDGWCGIWIQMKYEIELQTIFHSGPNTQQSLRELAKNFPISVSTTMGPGHVIRTGLPEFIPKMTKETMGKIDSTDVVHYIIKLNVQSYMCIPLHVRGRTIGAMLLCSSSYFYSESDFEIAQELGRRAAYAVDNALLFRQSQEAIQTRDDVVAIVSHDLRNPLGNILLNIGIIRKVVRASCNCFNAVSISTERIDHSAKQMNLLIQSILEVTKLQSGTFELEYSSTSLGAILNEVKEQFQHMVNERGITLTLKCTEPTFTLVCDRLRVDQALQNIVGNAVKFSFRGGAISVQVDHLGDHTRFSVKDSGPGISADYLPHLFNRYWQAKTTKRGGAGLGLYIVKGIIEAHSGQVFVESELGKGSLFYFDIPNRPASETYGKAA